MNAVIYARYSSHNQREESIEGQLRKCHEYARRHGFTVIQEYCDRALSGKTDHRPEFQRMIKDSEKGKFHAVIMYTLDRFARNRYDSAMYKAKLKKNGVHIHYTEQPIGQEPEGIILESVLEGMAEYYSENLSRGVKRGLRENAMKCMVTGGHISFGYRPSLENKYEIHPERARIVKEAFQLYASGRSQREVIDILNGKGYRTANGGKFTLCNIAVMLKNRRYTGVYIFRDIEIEGGIPVIIEKDLFEKVQTMLKTNKRKTGRIASPARYLLTGKLFCGHCGEPMVGESGTSKTGAIHNYYKCRKRRQEKNCNKANERRDWIEKEVVAQTVATLRDHDLIDRISDKIVSIQEKEFSDKSRLQFFKKELKTVQSSIDNLIRLVEQGISIGDVGTRLQELDEQKVSLQAEIDAEECAKPALNQEEISFFIRSTLDSGTIEDEEYRMRIIDMLVDKVYVFDLDGGGRRLVITYNTSETGSTDITLSDIKSSPGFVSAISCPARKHDRWKPVVFSMERSLREHDDALHHIASTIHHFTQNSNPPQDRRKHLFMLVA